jgi:hypothetical protein
MDAATLATSIVGLSLVSAVITEFTKGHISVDSRVRTVWALVVSAGVGLLGAVGVGLVTWLTSGTLTWRSLITAIIVQIPAVIGGAQAIYGAVHAIVPGSVEVDVDDAVAAVKKIAATVEQVTAAQAPTEQTKTADATKTDTAAPETTPTA